MLKCSYPTYLPPLWNNQNLKSRVPETQEPVFSQIVLTSVSVFLYILKNFHKIKFEPHVDEYFNISKKLNN